MRKRPYFSGSRLLVILGIIIIMLILLLAGWFFFQRRGPVPYATPAPEPVEIEEPPHATQAPEPVEEPEPVREPEPAEEPEPPWETQEESDALPALQNPANNILVNKWPDVTLPGQTPAWGDLNNDGLLDLVVRRGKQIAILFNVGPSPGGMPQFIEMLLPQELAGYTYDNVLADINNDGYLDISLASGRDFNERQDVALDNYLFINPGTSVTSPTDWTVERLPVPQGKNSIGLAWGDWNKDGRLDLAIANDQGGGDGDGAQNQLFLNESTTQTITLTAVLTQSLQLKSHSIKADWLDVNGDGWLDAIFLNGNRINGGEVYAPPIELCVNKPDPNNNEARSFACYASDGTVKNAKDFAWADIDNDNDLEVAVATALDGVQIYQANIVHPPTLAVNPDGDIAAEMVVSIPPSVSLVNPILADTVMPSIASPDETPQGIDRASEKLSIIGVDGFELTLDPIVEIKDLIRVEDVNWGDVDNDGDLDLVVARTTNQASRIYINGGKSIDPSSYWETEDTTSADHVALADIDNDGDLDVTLAAAQTRILLNKGQMALPVSIPQKDEPYETAMSLAWGDVNGDGWLDLAVGNAVYCDLENRINIMATQQIDRCESFYIGRQASDAWHPYTNTLYLNKYGILEPVIDWQGSFSTTTSVAWGDVNGDGWLDLAIGNRPAADTNVGGKNEIYLNTGYTPFFGKEPDISFGKESEITTKLAFADVDGDGDLDVAVANGNAPDALFLNVDGERNDERNYVLSDAWQPEDNASVDLAWGDLDNDGRLDLAVVDEVGEVHLYLNQGEDGLTDQPVQTIVTGPAQSVAWGDMDGDGDQDLAVGGNNNAVYLNNNGRLSPHPVWQSADSDSRLTQIAWGDINGNGYLDLVAAGHDEAFNSAGKVNKIYTNEHGWLDRLPGWQTPAKSNTAGLALGDVNNDGLLDIAFGNGRIWPTNGKYGDANKIEIYYNRRPITPGLTIAISHTGQANFYAQPTILDFGQITIPYSLSHPEAINVREVRAFYSLNGGGQWFPAEPVSGTQTTNLKADGTPYTYQWDVFGSGFFGQADNVVVRLEAIPDITPQPNTAVSPYPPVVASTQSLPLRVRGTQVQVQLFDETVDDNSGASGAFVYRLPPNEQTATVMGSSQSGIAFATNQNGFLSGRGALQVGDQLLAALPVTQTYRTPPQLYFANEQSVLSAGILSPSITSTLTAEFWIRPQSASGTLLSLGDELVLSYDTITKTAVPTATLQLKIGQGITVSTDALLMDGNMHHLAFSWDSQQLQNNTKVYLNGQPLYTDTVALGMTLSLTNSLSLGEGFIGTMDEIRLWQGVRTPTQIAASYKEYYQSITDFWPTVYGKDGALITGSDEALYAYWPIEETEENALRDRSGHGHDLQMDVGTAVVFKPHYTVYYTSGPVTETVAFQPVTEDGVQTLVVSKDNPLLLFDLNVSVEWDPRNEPAFLNDLKASFERASEILYDVTNGQMALRQVNFFYDKMLWGQADIVIYADNSLRPSATIGGVVNQPVSETVHTINAPVPVSKTVNDAYVPGHIRMGTVWDPFGENTSDLGEEWSRALAHELSHYLFFMPDNYLGYKGENNNDVLGIVDCQGSFMTNNIDPAYSEFLTQAEWINDKDCPHTLAGRTTERADWETIKHFYPMLIAPTSDSPTPDGPAVLPLNILRAIAWTYDVTDADGQGPLPSRNFILRDSSKEGEIARLPAAQVYLIKTQGTADLSDDLLVKLGPPTGGGDRIKVRGAEDGDRLCLFGTGGQTQTRYVGCDILQRTDASLLVKPVTITWSPEIDVETVNGHHISITLQLSEPVSKPVNGDVYVQVYPLHYLSLPGLAPTATLQTSNDLLYTQVLTLPLPAYEVAVRVWVGDANGTPDGSGREAITTYRLNPKEWGKTAVPLALLLELSRQAASGRPINMPTGGPIIMPTGRPINMPTGGPINMPTGGPINMPTGGPINMPTGGPINMPTGGPINMPTGGTPKSSYAPVFSADAQVAVYNSKGFFEDNGIVSLQALSDVPNLPTWLVPVGEAYHLANSEMTDTRFISFNYLQRNVPEGFEAALKIYFLPDCPEESDCKPQWQVVTATQRFVENLIVAPLVTKADSKVGQDGVYAVMATVQMPPLQPGWNLFSYPLMVPRNVTDTLASIAGQYDKVVEVQASTTMTEAFVRNNISSIYIRNAPGLDSNIIGYLRRNEGMAVLSKQNGWLQIDCPYFTAKPDNECWITGHPNFVYIDEAKGVSVPEQSSEMPKEFKSYGVYWIHITKDVTKDVTKDAPVTLYLAPPIRQPDGTYGFGSP